LQSCLFRRDFQDATFSAISFYLAIFDRSLLTTYGRHSAQPETLARSGLGGAVIGE